MMVLWNLILFVFSVLILKYCETAKNYEIKTKSIQCLNIDPNHIYNVTCNIKAARGKKGLLNIVTHYKDMNDVWVKIKSVVSSNNSLNDVYRPPPNSTSGTQMAGTNRI